MQQLSPLLYTHNCHHFFEYSYFSEFIRDNPQLRFHQNVPSIGYEETHESLIDKYRDEK